MLKIAYDQLVLLTLLCLPSAGGAGFLLFRRKFYVAKPFFQLGVLLKKAPVKALADCIERLLLDQGEEIGARIKRMQRIFTKHKGGYAQHASVASV